eukprot:NODE_7_length_48057_cov_0.322240.p15 type:complete len:280 gc:universal NODE_7_length_48057_cov_0.322240:2519-3358(+)
MAIFNNLKLLAQKQYAATHPSTLQAQYLYKHSAAQIIERLMDIKKPFATITDYLSGHGHVSSLLDEGAGVEQVLMYEPIKAYYPHQLESTANSQFVETLPMSECITTNLRLHWENDLLAQFKLLNSHLTPNGCLLGSILGGDTLYQLRSSLQLAEQERLGGFSPNHTSPMTTLRDVGSLLTESSFVLPTVDYEEVTVNYPSIYELLVDLELMGERNALNDSKATLRKDVLVAAGSIYTAMYGKETPATFQIIYFIGWKRGTEQIPKKKGTPKTRISELL